MRNFLRKIVGACAGALFMLGAVSTVFALTIPPTYAPRSFPSQQTHYIRFTFNFNSCVLTGTNLGLFNSTGNCAVKVGALPYNAFVVRAYQQVITGFNSGTQDSIGLGVTQATSATGLVSLQGVRSSGGATSLTIVAANVGEAITGNGTTPTGTDGGFDVYAWYQQIGAPATAGLAVIVLEYIAPNDGNCITPPLGSLPSAVGGANAC